MVDNSMNGQKMQVEPMLSDQSFADFCGEMPRAREAPFEAITKPFHRWPLTANEAAALAA